MLNPTNEELLRSQRALGRLVQAPLPATQALNVRDAVEDVEDRVQKIQEVREDLLGREDIGEKEAEEEFQQVLDKECEIGADPLPESALEDAKLSAGDIIALDWILVREGVDEEDGE